jgi:long-subunit fatty acid transport protein
MKRFVLKILIPLFCFFPISAHAFNGISTQSIGLAGAVTSNPAGLMSIYHNPAGLSQSREGFVYHQSLNMKTLIRKNSFSPVPSFEILRLNSSQDPITNQQSGSGNISMYYPFYGDAQGDMLLLPLPSGMTYRPPKSRWIMAIGSYMPFFQGFQFSPDDPSQYQTQQYYQQHIVYAAPTIAYQWNDSLSMGFSLGFGQTAWGHNYRLRILNEQFAQSAFLPKVPDVGPFDGLADMQFELRDDMALSFNLGFIWKPTQCLSFGLVYRSAVATHPKGQMNIRFTDEFMALTQYFRDHPYFPRLESSGLEKIYHQQSSNTVELEHFDWPDSLQAGAQFSLLDHMRIMFDIQWTRWSRQDSYKLVFHNKDNPLILLLDALDQSTGKVITYPNQMKDTLSYHLGIEWQLKESFKFRNGISYHPQSVSDSHMNMMHLPEMVYLGAGFEWQWPNRWVISQGLGYFVSKNKQIESSKMLNSWNPDSSFFTPYSGQVVSTKVSGVVFSFSVKVPLSIL